MDDGLVFLKGSERGKCFIEYIPSENAWVSVIAENYMYIDCFWVSGSFKGHGYSNDLLNRCIEDSRAKGKSGLALGITAKFADGHEILYYFPMLADIMGQFGIWALAAVPAKKRLFGLIYGLFLSMLLIWLVQAGIIVNLYEQMPNV